MTKHSISIKDRIIMHSIPEPNSGCWLWEGAWDQYKGYGKIKIEGVTKRAHRASYEVFKGEIIHGNLILHLCNNPCCVNPNHLIQGNQSDNIKQMWDQGRNHTNWNDCKDRKRDKLGKFI